MLLSDIILTVRGQKVILDCDLAHIFGVPTKRLNEQVRRNADRFPSDFSFQLAPQEVANLKSQIATSSLQHVTFKNDKLFGAPRVLEKVNRHLIKFCEVLSYQHEY